ncbi:hypothetical protein COB21_03530 [Candidatus Aerophobetes bacterium]|uniref:Uncharacterized protein n=1 Tax=Aerophobetes bacterium TaxID=2030807 RepID=A0A2A4X354_UNCAE|nr:MAG: hypothetical protein COB21_03530 [Candidatus Aerophobetes bacterium]
MAVKQEKEFYSFLFDHKRFKSQVHTFCHHGLKHFKKLTKSYIFTHLFFLGILTLELSLLIISLAYLASTPFIATVLSIFLISAFAYTLAIFYFQTKKPEQFLKLHKHFMDLCAKELSQDLQKKEYYLCLANASFSFATFVEKQEKVFYSMPQVPGVFNRLIAQFTKVYHRKDFSKIKEVFYFSSIHEHIKLIKIDPKDIESHASLANTFSNLANIYSSKSLFNKNHKLYIKTVNQAIGEYKIIKALSPNDPWVFAKLAACYNITGEKDLEIASYEEILTLRPQDQQILFRLGILYFQINDQAKGLDIYSILLAQGYSKSHQLLDFYDANLFYEKNHQVF